MSSAGRAEPRVDAEWAPRDSRGMADPDAPANSGEAVVNTESRTSATTLSQITDDLFASLDMHPNTKKAVALTLGYKTMTKVQAQACPVALTGVDVLAKAKTGTGKTIAFLLPAMEHAVMKEDPGQIKVLCISPTRELALQINQEALQLATYHTGLKVQCVVGGTNIATDKRKLKDGAPPQILVGTPGRLNDLLENEGLAARLKGLRCLIFDEADQLLGMGFRPAITKMLSMIPPAAARQTLLFSATMSKDVEAMGALAMKKDYKFIDTVGAEESTHQHSLAFCTMDTQMLELMALVQEAKKDPAHKVIAFFTTARQTQIAAELFNAMRMPTKEIHSRISQGARKRVSEEFRTESGCVLFSSDVSARGMDYPDVTHVLQQIGAPSDRESYIHRLGRTARAGKKGQGVLLLCDYEKFFLKEIKDLPLTEHKGVTDTAAGTAMQGKIAGAYKALDPKTVEQAYQAWLGYYNALTRKMGWTKEDLVRTANDWARQTCGLSYIPTLEAKTVGKMGLKGVAGLNIGGRVVQPGAPGAGGGRGSGGGGGG
ncbi:P-loop containing nucleoside triphosphate hydrolase protein, partial [Baffinella frigidus]